MKFALQIFYTIENEYSPDKVPADSGHKMRERVSDALSDKLFVSPAMDTASWCNESGYSVYLYVHKVLVSPNGWYLNFSKQAAVCPCHISQLPLRELIENALETADLYALQAACLQIKY